MILRCTEKLLRRLRAKPVLNPPAPFAVLGDWHVTIFRAGTHDVLLFTNSSTRLSVLGPAKGMGKGLGEALRPGLIAVLHSLQIPEEVIQAEVASLAQPVIARTNNRSVLGTMNDSIFCSRWDLTEVPDRTLHAMALRLCRTPTAPTPLHYPGETAIKALRERYGPANNAMNLTNRGVPGMRERRPSGEPEHG